MIEGGERCHNKGVVPPPALIAVGVGAGAVALLLLLALLIGPAPSAWDRAVMLAMRTPGDLGKPVGPARLLPFMRDVTTLGGGLLLTVIVVAVAGLLVVRRLYVPALLTVLASWSGGRVVALVKDHVRRARPDIVPRLIDVRELSFPSGHAASSAVVYLTLALLGAQVVRERRVRAYLLACAVILVGTIGISRVYLRVHWPSDVLAGWSFGTLWAIGWWKLGAAVRR